MRKNESRKLLTFFIKVREYLLEQGYSETDLPDLNALECDIGVPTQTPKTEYEQAVQDLATEIAETVKAQEGIELDPLRTNPLK